MALSDEQLDALRAEHGDNVVAVVYQGQDIVMRPATPGEYKRFRASSFNDKKRDVALEQLVRDIIVHPARAEVNGLFEKHPALAESVSSEALKLAGLVDVEIRK